MLEELQIKEFYTAQYVLNHPEPLFRWKLLQELREDSSSLFQIWNRYCRYYDVMRMLEHWKPKVKKLLN